MRRRVFFTGTTPLNTINNLMLHAYNSREPAPLVVDKRLLLESPQRSHGSILTLRRLSAACRDNAFLKGDLGCGGLGFATKAKTPNSNLKPQKLRSSSGTYRTKQKHPRQIETPTFKTQFPQLTAARTISNIFLNHVWQYNTIVKKTRAWHA